MGLPNGDLVPFELLNLLVFELAESSFVGDKKPWIVSGFLFSIYCLTEGLIVYFKQSCLLYILACYILFIN